MVVAPPPLPQPAGVAAAPRRQPLPRRPPQRPRQLRLPRRSRRRARRRPRRRRKRLRATSPRGSGPSRAGTRRGCPGARPSSCGASRGRTRPGGLRPDLEGAARQGDRQARRGGAGSSRRDDRRAQEGRRRGLASPKRVACRDGRHPRRLVHGVRRPLVWRTGTPLSRSAAGSPVPVSASRPPSEHACARTSRSSSRSPRSGSPSSPSLDPGGFRSRAWVMGRGEWIRANLGGLQRMLEPLAGRILAKQSGHGTHPTEGARRPGRRRSSATSRGGCSGNTTPSSHRMTRDSCTSSGRTWPRWSSASRSRPATSVCGSPSMR